MISFLNEHLEEISYFLALAILFSPLILKRRFGKNHIASLAITFGILGTFAGVFMGLLEFNEDDITSSVPKLIDGLQTAFITSIAGLVTNIVLRINPLIYGFPDETKEGKSDDTGEQILIALNKIAQSIAGEGEASLVTQIQKLRLVNDEGFSQMNHSFTQFAEKMIADNSQSLIDALTEVMKDFNAKINEQFGENFKQLNDAVGAMLEWQQQHKEHVETMSNVFQKLTNNLDQIDQKLATSASHQQVILETNTLLKDILQELTHSTASFAELGAKASNSLPVIEKNLTSMTETSQKFIKKTIENMQASMDDLTAQHSRLMQTYEANIDRMISQNADRIKRLDEELGQELNKSLESLGNNLTSLSRHFVEDYQPLTRRLKEVVEIAKNI